MYGLDYLMFKCLNITWKQLDQFELVSIGPTYINCKEWVGLTSTILATKLMFAFFFLVENV